MNQHYVWPNKKCALPDSRKWLDAGPEIHLSPEPGPLHWLGCCPALSARQGEINRGQWLDPQMWYICQKQKKKEIKDGFSYHFSTNYTENKKISL